MRDVIKCQGLDIIIEESYLVLFSFLSEMEGCCKTSMKYLVFITTFILFVSLLLRFKYLLVRSNIKEQDQRNL